MLTLVPRSRIFLPWRWRRYVPPKRRFTQYLHGTTSQKTELFIVYSLAFPSCSRYTALHGRLSCRGFYFHLFFIPRVQSKFAQAATLLNCFWMRLARIDAILTPVLPGFPQYLHADVGIIPKNRPPPLPLHLIFWYSPSLLFHLNLFKSQLWIRI
jgi:hypothetical protein